jgi:hypothetical protein
MGISYPEKIKASEAALESAGIGGLCAAGQAGGNPAAACSASDVELEGSPPHVFETAGRNEPLSAGKPAP